MSDFEHGNDEVERSEPVDDLFPFLREEESLIDALIGSIRMTLPSLDPADLRQMATVLYALQRLPYRTPGISIDLAKSQRIGEDFCYVSVEITDDTFRLSKGGSVYTPGVGGDTYSETLFHVEVGEFREGSASGFREWLANFESTGGVYDFDGAVCDEIDLAEPLESDGWERLDKHWNCIREDKDGA
jgi:hypothetical protein